MATSSPVSRLKRSSAVVAVNMLFCLMFAMIGSVDSRRSLASDACTSGIDVTQAPYAADPTGTSDSSSAFNAAIIAAANAGMAKEPALLHQSRRRVTVLGRLRVQTSRQPSCKILSLFTCTGQTVCLPPGTYQATADIDVNVDGVTVSAPSGATIVYDNPSGLQFFIRCKS